MDEVDKVDKVDIVDTRWIKWILDNRAPETSGAPPELLDTGYSDLGIWSPLYPESICG